MARPTRSSPAISRGLFRVGRHWLTSGLCLGLLAVVLVLPLLALVVEAIRQPTAWRVWLEVDRLAGLAGRSLLLAAAVVAAVMPPATFLGWLLFRTNLPGRHWAQVLFLFALVLPIAVTVCGWVLFWQWIGAPMRVEPGWRFLAAVGLHAVIALPLATLASGLGFTWVEPELEEEGWLAGGPWRTFWRVTWPRTRPARWCAALLVALGVWQEITITDLFSVRTWAEEVYVEFNSGAEATSRAVAACLPPVLLLVLLSLLAWRGLWRHQSPWVTWQRPALVWDLGARRGPGARWRIGLAAWLGLLLALTPGLFLPLVGLIHAAGRGGDGWSMSQLGARLGRQVSVSGPLLVDSLVLGAVVGLSTALAAIAALWWARSQPGRPVWLGRLAVLLWAMPGPLLGLAVLEAILWLLDFPGGAWLRPALWDGPSLVPNVWVQWLRFLPLALAVLAPLAALVPRTWEEEVRLSGAGPWPRFWLGFGRPLLGPTIWAALLVSLFSLGELSASKLVTTPGSLPLVQHLFMQMHAAADAEVASLALVLLLTVAGIGLAALLPLRRLKNPCMPWVGR